MTGCQYWKKHWIKTFTIWFNFFCYSNQLITSKTNEVIEVVRMFVLSELVKLRSMWFSGQTGSSGRRWLRNQTLGFRTGIRKPVLLWVVCRQVLPFPLRHSEELLLRFRAASRYLSRLDLALAVKCMQFYLLSRRLQSDATRCKLLIHAKFDRHCHIIYATCVDRRCYMTL